MAAGLTELVARANAAANAGQWDEAAALWLDVRRHAPDHPAALIALGVHALRAGDLREADDLLQHATRAQPDSITAWMALARAKASLGDHGAEGEALQRARAIDPYHLPALLAGAAWLERRGDGVAAAMLYRNALKIAPPEASWPADLQPQLVRAKAMAQRHAQAYRAHLSAAAADLAASLTPAQARQWGEAVSIMAGESTPYHSECTQLHIPRLPALPFHETSGFAWAPAIEAQTELIRDELSATLHTDSDAFSPYIALAPTAPVDQWRELNHSPRWSAYALWKHGAPIESHVSACPITAAALQSADLAKIKHFCPNAMFSVLAAGAHIPPHHGETNARLVAHLPLIVPDGCSFRVGNDEREWAEGELLIFDDSIEHEARNDSSQLRVVLIFDVWHPALSAAERRLVQTLMSASRVFTFA